uniref:Uncharacterized protein n=1 Tax=Dunaliella tertiolecta TaxID=3047 RepID=A0A7S3VIK8_DUNTE
MSNPNKQLAPPNKRWDGALSNSALKIPPFDRDTKQWLGNRADQDEKLRTQRVLQSLEAQLPREEKHASPPKPSRPFVPVGDSTQGWSYTTTRAAGNRTTPPSSQQTGQEYNLTETGAPRSRPATAQQGGDNSMEARRAAAARKHLSRQRAKDKDMEEAIAAINQIHHRPHSAPITHHRELQNLLNSTARRKANLAMWESEPHNSPTGVMPVNKKRQAQERAPETTTYHMSYHLAQDYPELYAKARESTRSSPAPNKTLISDWGDSLKQADDSEWRKDNYYSEYTKTNAEVHPHRSMTDEAKEHAFYKWMARQQLYYKDLMKDSAKPVLETLLGDGPLEQKREAVKVLRQLTAVVQPEMYKSHSQAVHCPMGRAEEPELTNMTKERTRRLTMGAPVPRVTADMYPTVESKMRDKAAAKAAAEGRDPEQELHQQQQTVAFDQARPASANAMPNGSGGPGSNPSAKRLLHSRGAASARRPGPQDYYNKSTIPIKWATGSGAISSSYIDAFGSPGLTGVRSSFDTKKDHTSPTKPLRYKEVTCPIGAVNPHTAIAPFREAYPVPECYVQDKEFPTPQGDSTMQTHYRSTFGPQSKETMERVQKSAAESNALCRAALLRSELPLGKGGFQTLHSKDWVSEYDKQYQKNEASMTGDYAAAQVRIFL